MDGRNGEALAVLDELKREIGELQFEWAQGAASVSDFIDARLAAHKRSLLQNDSGLPPRFHAPDCGYHVDQYPWECTCGFVRSRQ